MYLMHRLNRERKEPVEQVPTKKKRNRRDIKMCANMNPVKDTDELREGWTRTKFKRAVVVFKYKDRLKDKVNFCM
jgi:hypothetical protein